MSISNQSAGFRPGVCLSTNRPVNPYAGQMIYESDTKCLMIYDGTSWDYVTGAPPNIVTTTTTLSTSASSSSFTSTNLSATITKKYTNSVIWVIANPIFSLYANSPITDGWGQARLIETNSSRVQNFLNVMRSYNASGTQRVHQQPCHLQWVDTVSGTGSRTYRLDIANNGASAFEFNSYFNDATLSTITVWEVFQ